MRVAVVEIVLVNCAGSPSDRAQCVDVCKSGVFHRVVLDGDLGGSFADVHSWRENIEVRQRGEEVIHIRRVAGERGYFPAPAGIGPGEIHAEIPVELA